MKKIILCMIVFLLGTASVFAQDNGENGLETKFGILFGNGVELPNATSTKYANENDPDYSKRWSTNGLAGFNYFLGFRLDVPMDERWSLNFGADILSLNARYDIKVSGSTAATYTFRATSLYVPFELQMGERFVVALGGFWNYIISNPSYEDSNADEAYQEKGDVEEKYYHKSTFGLSFGIGFKHNYVFFMAHYRHGLQPWLESPVDKAYIRSIMLSFGIWLR